ncbi:hypothetical protein [Streptomyces sp. NBC_01197]|uniref:hypothetical protein n=1 Tax=Streptomyces sp. NBC_01197 TaxID=2903768 RepID=UPI002E155A11|nr:hypothetical protein OG452_00745 [Streptomyces sp. NBC_01197]
MVLDAWEVIRGSEVPRGRIVVADWRGDWIGIGVALRLAGQGRKVTLCVTGFAAGEHLQQYVRSALRGQAVRARVDIVPNVRLYGADSDTVYLQHTLTEEPVLLDGVAALVLAQGHVPVSEVDPVAAGIAAGQVFAIGDCVTRARSRKRYWKASLWQPGCDLIPCQCSDREGSPGRWSGRWDVLLLDGDDTRWGVNRRTA